MKALTTLIRTSPGLAVALVTAVCGLLTSFGLGLTPDQVGAITTLVTVLSGAVVHAVGPAPPILPKV